MNSDSGAPQAPGDVSPAAASVRLAAAIRGRSSRRAMPLATFTGRLLIVVVIGALAAALWQLSDLLVLLFGAILLAIGLQAAARGISGLTRLRQPLALLAVILFGIAALAAALWVFGSVVADQLTEVIQAAPAGFRMLIERLGSNTYGRLLLDQMRGVNAVSYTHLTLP